MDFLNVDIGSAKDNLKSPVHNWYKFTAGFSYKFVDEIIKLEKLSASTGAKIFEPFAGCGTTLVSCQKSGINAVGNEGQEFMFEIIQAKLNWEIIFEEYLKYLDDIQAFVERNQSTFNYESSHPLLATLYKPIVLAQLYLIRDFVKLIEENKYQLFFKLALSQTLHKVAIHPIAVPYISRNKFLQGTEDAISTFKAICTKMFNDINSLEQKSPTADIYLHDSRTVNTNIYDKECQVCITSPPYLNNLDYGEVSKVHTHFFEITQTWNDITKNVRQNLVTASTTHYKEADFELNDFLMNEFSLKNQLIVNDLVKKSLEIGAISKGRSGKKSFDKLMLFYFNDMYLVLKEIRRVLKKNGRAYLILGDSAPYGVHVPTTDILGKMAMSTGFNNYEIHKIRTRGTKWKDLTYRHNLELSESVLILN